MAICEERLMLRQDLRLMPSEEFVVDATIPPEEMARRVRLAFKRMRPDMALAVFAKVMTSNLNDAMKVAVWDAVRYSHIWWSVDDVLRGAVMEHPLVQIAFADAVPMRRWMFEMGAQGGDVAGVSVERQVVAEAHSLSGVIAWAVDALVRGPDGLLGEGLSRWSRKETAALADFRDVHGKNLLWYLTYRDDQQAAGGFSAPRNERSLLELGLDPNERNDLGLCWNDVRRHVNRSE